MPIFFQYLSASLTLLHQPLCALWHAVRIIDGRVGSRAAWSCFLNRAAAVAWNLVVGGLCLWAVYTIYEWDFGLLKKFAHASWRCVKGGRSNLAVQGAASRHWWYKVLFHIRVGGKCE